MSIISEVKCARCDRKYSGLRSRCPYCGARRIGRGKYSEEADNSKGKMFIGIMIMSVLVIAVGILIFTSPSAEEPDQGAAQETTSQSPSLPDEADNTGVEGTNVVSPSPSPSPSPEESTESSAPSVSRVTITYAGKTKHDFTTKVGDRTVLKVKIEPLGVEDDIVWLSSDRSVFEVVASNAEMTQATVTAIGKGTATLTVSVGGVEDECIVRVRLKS